MQQMSSELFTQYPDILSDDISTKSLNGQPMTIHLKPEADIKPRKTLTARQVPLHWSAEGDKVVQQLLKNNVIAPVSVPTDWISPAFFVPKEGGRAGLRLVTDFTALNKYVQRPVHPFPSSLEILRKISPDTKVFCKMDAVQGYHQIPLDEKSSLLTTFLLPSGRYRYLRAPMGLNASSDEWCRRSDEAMQGLKGVTKLVDDILIQAPDFNTLHKRICAVLDRCRKHGLTISKRKLKIGEQVKFAGFLISGRNVAPDPDKLKALSEFPAPTNVSELRSFLGLANQLGHFVPDLAHMSEPLRKLLHKDIAYVWLEEHEMAFQSIIKALTSNLSVHHFDSSLRTELLTDASRLKGLGFALVQHSPSGIRLIECGSRSLTPTESRYATIELECLGILWAMNKCSYYLTGLEHFTVVTDHRPLLGIFNKSLDTLGNPRLQRFRERMASFTFDVQWIAGKQHIIADTLSRAPVFNPPESDRGEFCATATTSDPALQRFFAEIPNDPSYQEIISAHKDGKLPKQLPDDHPARLLKTVWDRLSLLEQKDQPFPLLVCDDTRIVVPTAARTDILRLLHLPHSGMVKTKKAAQRLYFWPGINNDIKTMVENCQFCQKLLPSQPKEKLQLSEASLPMSQVGIDLFDFRGIPHLVMVDRFSGYPFVKQLRSLTTSAVLKHLTAWFLEFGFPFIIRTDGGPQFRSEFEKYCKDHNITHELTSPYNPQSNGLAESAVKNVKFLLEKCKSANESFDVAFCEWKATPRPDGFSPSEMFFGRRVRTQLPSLLHDFTPKDAEQTRSDSRQKVIDRNDNFILKSMKVGDPVLIQNPNTKQWTEKGVITYIRPSGRSYEITLEDGKTYLRNRRFIRISPISISNNRQTYADTKKRTHFSP